MSIIMTGGGTGGHLVIIKAVKEKLVDKELIYIGSNKGQDRSWFENDSDFKEKYFFETRGVVNQGKLGKVISMWMMIKATFQAIKILKKHKAKVVFSVGGFSSAPTSFASKILRIPLIIHEQNAAIGTLNGFLKPYAKHFISSYIENSLIKAYPIKEIFFQKSRVRKEIKTIIFLGGSQGARAINQLAISIAPILKERNIKIIHQAGEKHLQDMQEEYKKMQIDVTLFGFTNKLVEYMDEADLAIARSGASTLWELSALGLPTLFIPYPYASKDHQFHNAKFLVDKNLAWVIRENQIEKDKILKFLDENIEEKSLGLIKVVEKNGSEQIASLLKEV